MNNYSIDSHIQAPNFLLERFRGDNGKVAYLGFKDLRIHYVAAKKLGTEENYYSAEMEVFLNQERETPFSIFANKAILFAEGKIKQLTFTSKDEKIAKLFLTTTMARSGLALNAMMDSSVTAQLFPDQLNHDHLVYFGSTKDWGISSYYKQHKLLIVVNKADRLFVMPRNCFYVVQSFGSNCITFPVSPICALQLVPPEYSGCYINGVETRYGIYSNPEDILTMNIAALRYEYVFNKQFVAGQRRKELDELIAYLKEHEKELEDDYYPLHA